MEVLVFGGTSEGRMLVEWLAARGTCEVTACVATEYGADLLEGLQRIHVLQGPLSPQDKQRLMETHDFACVVDATHPFARHISQSVCELTAAYGIPVVRVVREQMEDGEWVSVHTPAEAARHLARSQGPILLTTGSKDLATYVEAIPDWAERLYVRVLPLPESLVHVRELGIDPRHVIAMQGPFSQRMNKALICEFGIRHLVTKQSGRAGGFGEKLRAAQACGIELVVIERPQEEGLLLDEAERLLEERYGL